MAVLDEDRNNAETGHNADHNALALLYNRGGHELVANATSGASATINIANGPVQDLTLTANCTLTFSGSLTGRAYRFLLVVRQDGTGSRTITWPGSVSWPGGTAAILNSAASSVTVLEFLTVNNGTNWYGWTAAGPSADVGAHEADADPHTAYMIAINTDGDSGRTHYVGAIDPTSGSASGGPYTPDTGDVWTDVLGD